MDTNDISPRPSYSLSSKIKSLNEEEDPIITKNLTTNKIHTVSTSNNNQEEGSNSSRLSPLRPTNNIKSKVLESPR